ncbi:MAG: nitrate reductase molybdenum cofactor assembly chaperone [Betaproteobacteria bacterium]|nr:nitrate reductase molybdenum cofactor assembly chaperone [Betaproteobacteria bacterium]MDE2623246.1 nitrate reductase molybdenum cofactor assembly chaperone [Betaproteobacteria bacterium]
MKTFKVLSLALSYPEDDWLSALPEMAALLSEERLAAGRPLDQALSLLAHLERTPLLDLQEHYVAHFDRDARCSLCLFEHVLGDSRERGQAMVSLLQRYQDAGLAFEAEALPDHLPAFLEYLSLLPLPKALDSLAETTHLLKVIGERLAKRGSPYAALFGFLLALAGEPELVEAGEAPVFREDLEALDRAWAESPVQFGPACAPIGGQAQPIHFHKGAGS